MSELNPAPELLRESKLAQDRMRWLASFPEQNPNPIVELDLSSGKIHYLNPAAAEIFPDLPKLGLKHPLFAGLPEVVNPQIQKGNRLVRREIAVSQSHFLQTITHIAENQHVRIYNTDITAGKIAEEKVRVLNAELEQRVAQRTAELQAAINELEAFSYSISHDLRAPLRAINGFSAMALEDFGSLLPDKGRHFLKIIHQDGLRMGVLIDDLLAFARLGREPLKPQTVDTEQLVRSTLEELKAQAPGRDLEVRVGRLPPCQGDPALLKQVWINLVSNALKYSRDRKPAVVEIGSFKQANDQVYFVRDNGAGFNMEYADKLFGVFQRLHHQDEFEGTGVGLAIVQRIVNRHGGHVWAEAKEQAGATFYFTLKPGEAT